MYGDRVHYRPSFDGEHMIATYKGQEYHLDLDERLTTADICTNDSVGRVINPTYWSITKYKSRTIRYLLRSISDYGYVEGYIVTNLIRNIYPSRKGITRNYLDTSIFKDRSSAFNDLAHRSSYFTDVCFVRLYKHRMEFIRCFK